jgi:hypothetical protein
LQYAKGVRADRVAKHEKPYQCDKCGFSGIMATELADHLLQAHGIRKHPSQIVAKTSISI